MGKYVKIIAIAIILLFVLTALQFSGFSNNHNINSINYLDVGSNNNSGPVIPHPANSIVVVPVYNAFVSRTGIYGTITNNSVCFPTGNFNKITVTFFDTYVSNTFDDSYIVIVNNTEIMAGNTMELENTYVIENVTQYYQILHGKQCVSVTSPQFDPGFSSYLSIWFTFYYGKKPVTPDKIIPVLTDSSLSAPKNPIPHNIEIPYNVSESENITFPDNVSSAYLNFYEQQNGNDEFWYALHPQFVEFRIFINNTLVATVEPYPNVQTGGGDLFLWQPILPIGALLYPPHKISLNPYLYLLKGKKNVTIEAINDENLWIRMGLNFMIYTGNENIGTIYNNSHYSFYNYYKQIPETNYTTETIPYNATYLNDTEIVNENFNSYALYKSNNGIIKSENIKNVLFMANSTCYDPNFNIEKNTSFGYGYVEIDNFSLKEYINEVSITTGRNVYNKEITNKYYQINGTDIYYYIVSPVHEVVVGFKVTQIKEIHSDNQYLSNNRIINKNNYTYKMVYGNGTFAGTLNSHNEITELTYNKAFTEKIVIYKCNNPFSFYYLKEKAINNSLIKRNGTLIYYRLVIY